MSSTTFDVTIHPDRRLHGVVLLFAALAGIAGLVIALRLPLSPGGRAAAACGWLLIAALDTWRYNSRWQLVRRIRVRPPSMFTVLYANGIWHDTSLCRGTVLLERALWLRLQGPDGKPASLLVTPGAAGRRNWRRLQALLRLAS